MKRNGYRPSHRNRWLLLSEKAISKEGLLFWEYCLDQMLYDKRYSGYGTAKIDFDEVMSVFHVSSLTSVRKWWNELIQLGLVKAVDKRSHTLGIVNYDRYISGGNGNASMYESREHDQSIDVIKQSTGLISQFTVLKNQSTDRNNADLLKNYHNKALSSFKVGLGLVTKQVARKTGEYQSIFSEGIYSLLLPEDMEWIDKNQNFNVVQN